MVSMMKMWAYTSINELFPREQFFDAIQKHTKLNEWISR